MGPLSSERITFTNLLERFIRRPTWPLLFVGLVTAVLAVHLQKLSFRTTVYDLIIEDLPAARTYQGFLEQFGSDEIIRVLVRAGDIFEPATWRKIVALSDKAAALPGVRRVISLPEVKKRIDSGGETDLASFKALLDAAELFRRNLISADGGTTIITLVLEGAGDKNAVIAATEDLIAGAGKDLSIFQTGIPLVSEALASYSRKDFYLLTPITLAVIALVLLILCRNLHCLLLPLGSVTLSNIWTLGLMAWSGIPVSMLTLIVPVFLIAVGTAYCLHICTAYLEAARQAEDSRAAVRATFANHTFPVFLAVATTILGIGSLAVNRITAIQEFAGFAVFGMASLWVILMTFFPALLVLLPLPACRDTGASGIDRQIRRMIDAVVHLNTHHQRPIFWIIGLTSLVLALGILKIRVETNPVAFFKSDTPVRRHFNDIYAQMSGSFPVNVVLTGPSEDYFEETSNLAHLATLSTFLDQLPGVDKTVSLADYLRLVNYANNRYDPKFYTLPQDPYELRFLMNNFKILLGNDLLRRFLSADYRQANLLMLTHIASTRQLLHTRETILAHVEDKLPKEIHCEVTGLGMVIADSSHLLTLGQIKSLSLSLVLIFAVMVALFLSSKVGLIAIVPNLFPILVNFGLMGWLGIPLSAATALIASVVIGLAVDDTIHYLVRYNKEFKKDLNKDRAMADTLRRVGRPILFTSATIALGFAPLTFSHFQPTTLFGLLMILTMGAALIGDLILLPALLRHVELVTAWDLLRLMPNVGGMPPELAHELNQPLNAIKVGNEFLKLLLKKKSAIEPPQLEAVTREIGNQVDRASEMIQRLSAIGEMRAFEKSAIDVNQPIRGTLSILGSQLRLENIDLRLELAEGLPPVWAHHNRFVQVMFNLIDNGREAIIAKRRQESGAAATGGHAATLTIRTALDQGQVVVEVIDSGIGMPATVLERVFEPFYTTKQSGKGKGLGLSICRQIVKDCGGRIALISVPGDGTTARLRLPPRSGGVPEASRRRQP
ncbi:MAG: MMPL family transporter [Desulfosarcinaceae bacterium]